MCVLRSLLLALQMLKRNFVAGEEVLAGLGSRVRGHLLAQLPAQLPDGMHQPHKILHVVEIT